MSSSYQEVTGHLEEIKKIIEADKVNPKCLKELAFHAARDGQQYEKSETVKNDFSKIEENLKNGDLKMLKSVAITGVDIFEDRIRQLDSKEKILLDKNSKYQSAEDAKKFKDDVDRLVESAKGWFDVFEKIEEMQSGKADNNKGVFGKIADSIAGIFSSAK